MQLNTDKFHLSRKLILKFVSSKNYLFTINSLIKKVNASITKEDIRMPNPPFDSNEADDNAIAKLLCLYCGADTDSIWWRNILRSYSSQSWDFISTCTIDGKKGILLVEAKAKKGEMKLIARKKKNYDFSQPNKELNELIPGVELSNEKCPQLSNHIAHAWAMSKQDMPVILLYLGFCYSHGRCAFKTPLEYKASFKKHVRSIGADKLLDLKIADERTSFTFLCEAIPFSSSFIKSEIEKQKQIKIKYNSEIKAKNIEQKKLITEEELKQVRKAIIKILSQKRKYLKGSIRKNTEIIPKEIIRSFEGTILEYQYGQKR